MGLELTFRTRSVPETRFERQTHTHHTSYRRNQANTTGDTEQCQIGFAADADEKTAEERPLTLSSQLKIINFWIVSG